MPMMQSPTLIGFPYYCKKGSNLKLKISKMITVEMTNFQSLPFKIFSLQAILDADDVFNAH